MRKMATNNYNAFQITDAVQIDLKTWIHKFDSISNYEKIETCKYDTFLLGRPANFVDWK